jgi:hypothetical protein
MYDELHTTAQYQKPLEQHSKPGREVVQWAGTPQLSKIDLTEDEKQ